MTIIANSISSNEMKKGMVTKHTETGFTLAKISIMVP